MTIRILIGDCRTRLSELSDNSVQCVVTSPPYFNLRDYGVSGQIGLEASPDDYVAELVSVFRQVRRVLRDDGVAWLNLGDSYCSTDKWGGKPKDLIGIPWMAAFALRTDGWYLRSEVVWNKVNAMPESVTDRPTCAHEKVFLLTKSAHYFYDAEVVKEDAVKGASGSLFHTGKTGYRQLGRASTADRVEDGKRNVRNVWTIATRPYTEAHFATMAPELAERCIKAGSRPGDTVLDPFGGAGTTALVADQLGRNAIICELNPDYAVMAERRIRNDGGMFATVEVSHSPSNPMAADAVAAE